MGDIEISGGKVLSPQTFVQYKILRAFPNIIALARTVENMTLGGI